MLSPGPESVSIPGAPHLSLLTTYISNADVKRRLGVCDQTLRNWRKAGTGPRYTRFGKRIRYRLDDVMAFEESRTYASSADEHPPLVA